MKPFDRAHRPRSVAAPALLVAAAFLLVARLAAEPLAAPAPVPPVVPAAGPGFTTLAAFTLPPTFYVGDRVELRIRLRTQPGTVLRPPARMPTDRWIKIESITISHSAGYSVVHLFFVSFAPGERSMPAIDLSGITLSGIRIATASLISGGRSRLSDPKGQLLLPWTTLIVGLLVALLIALPLGGLFLVRRLSRALGDLVEYRRAHRPWRQLVRVLDALGAESALSDPRRFYITLVDALKHYLTSRFESDFRAVTAREFSSAVRKTEVGEEAAAGLTQIMSFGELVKFAGAGANEEVLRRDLSRVRQIIEAVEDRAEHEEVDRHDTQPPAGARP